VGEKISASYITEQRKESAFQSAWIVYRWHDTAEKYIAPLLYDE